MAGFTRRSTYEIVFTIRQNELYSREGNDRMKKNFVWGALAIATATAIGGSYQIFAQASTTSPIERQGSKREPGVTRYVEERVIQPNVPGVIPPNAAVQQGFPIGSTLQPGQQVAIPTFRPANAPGSPDNPPYRANHLVIIEDGKVKVISSNEPMDEETRAKSSDARKQLDDAFRTFRSEDASDQDRAKARTTLSSYLTAQFDHDQEMRRKQIKSLEEEVDKLKKQIAKREESKDKLVELRLTLIENDANGLAFPQAFNQIPGANGPGFGPAGTVYGSPGSAYSVYGSPGSAYSVQTYNAPNSLPAGVYSLPPGVYSLPPGVLSPPSVFSPSGGLGQNGQNPAALPGYPIPPNPTVPPNPPAPGPNTTNRSK
jgi:hypothetical protein